jgi:DNA-binding NtrC family response regulator
MSKHILSVDDEANMDEWLQEFLTGKGCRVSTAAKAEQPKKIIKEDPPRLIFMDFQTEEGDGFVSMEALKMLMLAAPIPLLTGAIFDRKVMRDTIQQKFAGYLDKPASLNMMVSEIPRLVGDPQDAPIRPWLPRSCSAQDRIERYR